MNRTSRFVSTLLLFVAAMVTFTSSAYAADPSTQPAYPVPRSVTHKNGTTVLHSSNGTKIILPFAKDAQPLVQRPAAARLRRSK